MSITKTGFSTALTIINRAAVQCGLASVTDVYASTDSNFLQLQELLTMVGEDLLSAHDWTQFITSTTITTAASATSYALPSDWDRMVDNTQWNRSTRLPMLGPIREPEVTYIQARLNGVLFQVAYRLNGNTITFPTAPSDAQTLAYEYISGNWVWSNAGTSPDKAAPTANDDTILFDPELVIAALRLAFLEAKGFDTAAARERYESRLETSIAKNVGGRTLNLGGIGINADHLIDADNLPITGYAI